MRSDLKKKYGFDLEKVTWGYREKFGILIDTLIREKFITEAEQENTSLFFEFLKRHAGTSFDDVLHNFLDALNSDQKWILRNRELFKWWTKTGESLAEQKLFVGLTFFRISADCGLGKTPSQLKNALKHIDALSSEKLPLALGLMHNYTKLSALLDPAGLSRFISEAESIFGRSKKAGCDFIEGKLASSEEYIRNITCECRLDEVKGHLQRIIMGICGKQIEVNHLGNLDSDELIDRGSTLIALTDWLYMPARITDFGCVEKNFDFYRLASLVCGGGHLLGGFQTVHSAPGYSRIQEYLSAQGIPDSQMEGAVILFELCEYGRILSGIRKLFPGTSNLLEEGIVSEFSLQPVQCETDILLQCVLSGNPYEGLLKDQFRLILKVIKNSLSFKDTVKKIAALLLEDPETGAILQPLRRVSFLSDAGFPSSVSSAPLENPVLKLNEDEHPGSEESLTEDAAAERSAKQPGEGDEHEEGDEEETGVRVGFVYDEWNGIQEEYYRNWCLLKEKIPQSRPGSQEFTADRESARIRTLFERLKPDALRKEKYLFEGDSINIDRLIDFIIHSKAKVTGKENFYEKTYTNERDLAIALLIDLSGSTGGEVDPDVKILDLEKKAAALLADGLDLLGDRFGLFGFTGNGRENCEYFLFKDFEQPWNDTSREALFSAYPGTSTRIGVALRHTGAKLENVTAKRKLIFLVSDGKPMDSEYDPNTGYAYFDVRKSCYENAEKGIKTFGIITDDEEKENLVKMLPYENYLLLRDVRDLPYMLSRLFLGLTA